MFVLARSEVSGLGVPILVGAVRFLAEEALLVVFVHLVLLPRGTLQAFHQFCRVACDGRKAFGEDRTARQEQ